MSSRDWQIEVTRDIRDIPPEQWNAFLNANDLQASHAFIRACQESEIEQADYWFLIIRDAAGPVCVTAFCTIRVALELLAPRWTRRAVQGLRKLRKSILKVPVLFCGLPVSFGRSCLRMRRDVPPTDVVHEVARAMEQIAAEQHIDLLCAKEFVDAESAILADFSAHGFFAAPSMPSCALPLIWHTFDAYLAAMRADYRRQVLHTLAAREASGLNVRRVDNFTPFIPRMHELYVRVMDRAEYQLERLNVRFFEKLSEHLRASIHAVLIEKKDTSLAFALMLNSPGMATFLLAGYDERLPESAQLYPNLVLAVVADSIASGATHLEMGQTSYALKTRLGAEPEPRTMYLRYRSPLKHRMLKAAAPLLFPRVKVLPRRVFRNQDPS